MALSTASSLKKRQIEKDDLGTSKRRKISNTQRNASKSNKRKIPKDPKSGLPLCRKYMENKACDVTKCRFVHLDRHLRPQCPEFANWGLCSYGDDSCFLVHSRSITNPLLKYHKEPHSLESIEKGDVFHTNPDEGFRFPIQRNFKYPIFFSKNESNLPKPNVKSMMEDVNSLVQNHPFIALFSVASGFLSRFLSRFSEIYPIDKNNLFTHVDVKSSRKFQIEPIEAFRGFTKSASNDTIGVIFAPKWCKSLGGTSTSCINPCLGHEAMFPLATEVLISRHSRDEVLFLSRSSKSMHEVAKDIINEWEKCKKIKTGNNNSNLGVIRVKAFPPARKFSHTFAIQFLLSLAKHHQELEATRNKKVDTFPVLFPTVNRKAMYEELESYLKIENTKNDFSEYRSLSSSFLEVPSLDIGVQDAMFELHISPYGGHWLWGLHWVSSSNLNDNERNIFDDATEPVQMKVSSTSASNLPPQLCSTIRDTYFTKDKSIVDLRDLLSIPKSIIHEMKTGRDSEMNRKQAKIAPICRAYWKLYEIMLRRPSHFLEIFTTLNPSKCMYSIDVGAAPGGWTQFLCDLLPSQNHMKIVAVDPSSLNNKIKEFPNVINIQKRSEEALEDIQRELSKNNSLGVDVSKTKDNGDDSSKRSNNDNDAKNGVSSFEGFDLLVCDANVSATQTLELIGPIIPLLKKKRARAVITAKNQFAGGKAGADKVRELFHEEIEKAKRMYEEVGLKIVDVVHLFANSLNENTMLVEVM